MRSTFPLIAIVLYTLCFAFVYYRQVGLPDVVPATSPQSVFSEERAVKDLRALCKDIGVRLIVSLY